jgi:phosphatidate cytidylyltransferase
MGAALVALAVGILGADGWLLPWAPFLLVTALAAGLLAGWELVALLPEPRPRRLFCLTGVTAVLLANWPAHVGLVGEPWPWVVGAVTTVLLLAFIVEALYFWEPNGAVLRIALTLWVVGYVALLASFFVQLRWLPHGSIGLAMAIFVPKCGDIGAYFTGRYLGKHRMAPILSPKKTLEGLAGAVAASTLVALGLNALGYAVPPGRPPLGWLSAAGFGLAVGLVALVGDLMESLIKRDLGKKDASNVVPGFGGVLDVLDSILYSAPLSYLWLSSW